MHPAFSVIFFTTLSGAGYGLIAWIGAMLAWGHLQGARLGGTTPLVFGALLAFALVLVTVGLLSSVGHLGQPRRAWRAFSQWRTSWLSREGVLALASYMPVLAFLALVGFDLDHPTTLPALQGPWLPVLAIAMAALALATVACTAMIYASLKPIPAWRQTLVVPAYLAFALLTGGALLAMLLALVGLDAAAVPGYALVLGAGALATALVKLGYWRAIDRTPQTRAPALTAIVGVKEMASRSLSLRGRHGVELGSLLFEDVLHQMANAIGNSCEFDSVTN